ncbi:MAG: hypothetical protein IJT91_03575 [Clostridia bacterium]|nr:hypothetical protein [Clostridia bacterium]
MKIISAGLFFVLLLGLFSCGISAAEIPEPKEYVPEQLLDRLPENTREDIISGGSENAVGIKSLSSIITDIVRSVISKVLRPAAKLIALVVILSVFLIISSSGKTGAFSAVIDYVAILSTAYIVFDILADLLDQTKTLLSELTVLINGILPCITGLYVLCGNVTSAAVTNTSMMIVLTVLQDICSFGLGPLLTACMGMVLITSLCGSIDLEPLSKVIRKTFTVILTAVMTVFSASMALSGVIASSKDTAAMRGVKFAASNFIPIIGSSVSDAVTALGSGLTSLKNTVGVIIIFGITVTVLPLLITLICAKLSFSLSSAAARVFGADKQARFIESSAELVDFLIAVITIVTVIFLTASIILITTSAAVSI